MVGRRTAAFDSYPNIIVTNVKLQARVSWQPFVFAITTETAGPAVFSVSDMCPTECRNSVGRVAHHRDQIRRLTCCFPKGKVTPFCWKPTRRCYETKNRGPAGHLGAHGPQDPRCSGTVARLRTRQAHRADQRRSSCCESRDSVSRAVKAGA